MTAGGDCRMRRLQNPDDDDTEEWVEKIREKASRWFDWDALKTFSTKKEGGSSTSPEEKISKAVAKNEHNKKDARDKIGTEETSG